MLKKEKEEFDERQVQICKNIFKHGFFITICALLLNAFLNSMDIMWASPFHQNILILTLIISIVSIEFHIRDVYFGRGISRTPLLGALGLCAIILAILAGIHFAKGATFIINGTLTDDGAMLIYDIMLITNVTCGIIQTLRNKQSKKQIM